MLELQQAGMAAADELVRLWRETFTAAYADIHSSENLQAYSAEHYTPAIATNVLSDEQVVCLIARRQGEPKGFYVLKHHPCPIELEGAASELKQLYILASEYGTGLGRTLFDHAAQTARNAEKTWLWLCVSDINYRAQAFYKKVGMEPKGVGPTLYVGTDRLSSTVLACRL